MVVNAAKEKFGVALVGVVFPPAALVGAFRLGKPSSLVARTYGRSRRERSEARFAGTRGRPFWKRGPELLSRVGLRRGSVTSRLLAGP